MPEQVVDPTAQVAADEAAFGAGFEVVRETPTTAAPEVKAAEEALEVKEEPKPEVKPDPWEGIPAGARAALEATTQAVERVSKEVGEVGHRVKSYEGRLGKINSAIETLATAKAVAASVASAPTNAQIETAAKSTARWKQLTEDFPDWATAMDERFAAIDSRFAAIPAPQAAPDLAGLRGEISKETQTVIDKRVQETLDKAEERAYVRYKHPDWRETVKAPEFKTWWTKQAPEIQALAASEKGDDAIKLIDAYKADQKKSKAAAEKAEADKNRLRRAATPQGVPAPAATTVNDEDAFEGGFHAIRGT